MRPLSPRRTPAAVSRTRRSFLRRASHPSASRPPAPGSSPRPGRRTRLLPRNTSPARCGLSTRPPLPRHSAVSCAPSRSTPHWRTRCSKPASSTWPNLWHPPPRSSRTSPGTCGMPAFRCASAPPGPPLPVPPPRSASVVSKGRWRRFWQDIPRGAWITGPLRGNLSGMERGYQDDNTTFDSAALALGEEFS